MEIPELVHILSKQGNPGKSELSWQDETLIVACFIFGRAIALGVVNIAIGTVTRMSVGVLGRDRVGKAE